MPGDVMIMLTGIALGVAYCAVPGAVSTECMRRGLSGGFRPAIMFQSRALIGDMVSAILGLTGAACILQFDALVILLGLVGAGFLFSLARNSFWSVWSPGPDGDEGMTQQGRPLIVGATLSLANPTGPVFDRHRRGPRCNDFGRVFLAHVDRIFRELDMATG